MLAALEANQHHIANTARELGLERSHLYKKMRALGIKHRGDAPAAGENDDDEADVGGQEDAAGDEAGD